MIISAGITHTLTSNLSLTEVLEVYGNLVFSPTHTVKLTNTRNIIVKGNGTLVMKPANNTITHTIEFANVNMNLFTGGGDVVIDNDIGFWVMENGSVDLLGPYRKGWTIATGGLTVGMSTFTVADATGWQTGDEIVIMPHSGVGLPNSAHYEHRTIQSISGNNITVNTPLTYAHPTYTTLKGRVMTTEIINLTRKVWIQGQTGKEAHTFVKSTARQKMGHLGLRFMGPRKDQAFVDPNDGRVWPLDGITDLVLGRYPIHLHHHGLSSAGETFEGILVRDSGNHAIVPHSTHEIRFLDCVVYNSVETNYWSDFGHKGHSVVHERCIAARPLNISGSLNADKAPGDDVVQVYGVSGFLIGVGDNNQWIDCCVVGQFGDPVTHGAFSWEANNDGAAMVFLRNRVHNCDNANRIWQISSKHHILEEFVSWLNVLDHFQGAYQNGYTNLRADYNSLCELKANAHIKGQPAKDMSFQDLRYVAAQVFGQRPTQLINSTVYGNVTHIGIFWDGDGNGNDVPTIKNIDIICSTIHGTITLAPETGPSEVIRVQPLVGQAYKITKTGTTNIPDWAPKIWGSGDGLKGEYYTAAGVKKAERIDIQLYFDDWMVQESAPNVMEVDYRLGQDKNFKVKWTGFIQGQFSETYTFKINHTGIATLKINNVNVTLTPAGGGNIYQGTASLVAGVLTPIEVNYTNDEELMNALGGCAFIMTWSSTSLSKMISEEPIPMSQLYSGTTPTTTTTTTTSTSTTSTTTTTTTTAAPVTTTTTTTSTTSTTTTSTTTVAGTPSPTEDKSKEKIKIKYRT